MEDRCSIWNAPQSHSSDSDDASNAKFTEAEIAWYNMRSEWAGHRSKRLQRQPREPIERVPELYEQVLMAACYTHYAPFQRRIPLAEISRFFGEFWRKQKQFLNLGRG